MVEAIFLAQLSMLSSMLATVATVASSARCWASCLASNQDCRMRALTSNKPSKVTKASTEVEAEVEARPAQAAWGVLLQCRPSRFVHRISSCAPYAHTCMQLFNQGGSGSGGQNQFIGMAMGEVCLRSIKMLIHPSMLTCAVSFQASKLFGELHAFTILLPEILT